MKKKILFVIESLSGGGAEKVLTTTVKNIDKTKFDVTVLTVVKTGVYVKEVEKYCKLISMLPDYEKLKSPIAKIKYKLDYKKIYNEDCRKIYNEYIKEEYDVEIAFVEGFVTKLVAASSNKNSKKYAWVHIDMMENDHADANYSSIQEEISAYRNYNKIFTVSGYVGDIFIKKFGNEFEEKMMTQYNPVDSLEIEKKSKEKLDEEYHAQVKLISIGRLVDQKGYDRLISVVNKLKNKYSNFEIWILGDGEQRNELETYIKQHQLENYFKLKGFKNNPYAYIKKADAFICSSRSEGFSTVATEALILNKPIFTTDCSGMKELFGNNKCGIICENSTEGILNMLNDILKNPDFSQYKEECKDRKKEFTLEKRMEEVERILDE